MPNPTVADVLWLRANTSGDTFTPPRPEPQPSGQLDGWNNATRQFLPPDHPAITTATRALAIYAEHGPGLEQHASRRLELALTLWLEAQHHPDPAGRAHQLALLQAADREACRQAVRAANPAQPCPACGQPLPRHQYGGLCQPCGNTFEYLTRQADAQQIIGPDGRTRRDAIREWAATRAV